MNCPSCAAPAVEGAKFCSQCGAKLAQVCSACQAPVKEGQRFCAQCGAMLQSSGAAAPEPVQRANEVFSSTRQSPEADRRVVTVLFTDVSGFTAMSEKLDPEEVTEIVNNFFKVLTEPIYRYGGVVDKYIGDAIMALFGAPIAHEDDPERAVRAAWEMQVAAKRHAEELEARTGIGLKVRIGLNTGLVVAGTVGGNQRSDYTVMGDTVNLAQRMEANARPGKVLVTSDTYSLAQHAFNFEAFDPIQVKGKAEPVQVYELAGIKARTTKLPEKDEVVLGRDNEIAKLRGCWETTMNGRPQIISLIGDVGLGKSTLTRQFIRSARYQRAQILWARGLSYEQQTGYAVVASLLHHWLNLPDHASTQEILDHLPERLGPVLPHDDGRTIALLSHLLGIQFDHPEVKSLSPKQQRMAAFLALNEVLLAQASQVPLLLSLEDMHWADEASLEWIVSLVDRIGAEDESLRLMLLCQSRPDSAFTELPLDEKVDFTQITLRPLAPSETLVIVEALLGATREGLPPAVQNLLDQVLARAEGNPFYLVELMHSLIDGGILLRKGATWGIDRPSGEFRLPTTVQGAISARLDRLQPSLRRLIQLAAVIGKNFDAQIVRRVSGYDPVAGIVELSKLGFVYSRSTGEIAFTQAMIQEVAYQNLLLANRRDLHRQVGDAIEEAAGNDARAAARTLAFHYVRSETPDKACRYLLLAAEQARLGFAVAEALHAYRQALEWLEKANDNVPGVDRAKILAGLAKVEIMAGDLNTALEHLEAALARLDDDPLARECHSQAIKALIRKGDARAALARCKDRLACEADPVERAELLTTCSEIQQRLGEWDSAQTGCYEALALLAGSDRQHEMAGVYNVLGNGAYFRRQFAEATEHYQKSLALREVTKNVPGIAAVSNNLALAYAGQGQWAIATEAYSRALKIYSRIGDVAMAADTQNNLGNLLLAMGKVPEAERALRAAADLYSRVGTPLGQAAVACGLGKLAIATGQGIAALDNLNRSFSLLESIGARAYAAEVLRCLGHAYLLAGDWQEAQRVLLQSRQLAEAASNDEESAIVGTLLAEIQALSGDPKGAAEVTRAAIAKLRMSGDPLELGRALLRAARIFRSAGDVMAAQDTTREACDIFARLGAALDLVAAQALVTA
ncbi:MAG: tetratricopeptide repeat protein [Cyanobacteria bacterium NC_groundwater_1444_Ag_S-0.65um_54_12]|nr:tetratricopeptide repeat protein [Cyanobacteria bacterium NC_groundwater_1444_Ag_S-0.65um_54_12]